MTYNKIYLKIHYWNFDKNYNIFKYLVTLSKIKKIQLRSPHCEPHLNIWFLSNFFVSFRNIILKTVYIYFLLYVSLSYLFHFAIKICVTLIAVIKQWPLNNYQKHISQHTYKVSLTFLYFADDRTLIEKKEKEKRIKRNFQFLKQHSSTSLIMVIVYLNCIALTSIFKLH